MAKVWVMARKIGKSTFKTDAFKAALEKNDEMNKTGKVVADDPTKGSDGKFTTDAFVEALKINEEMNKDDDLQEQSDGPVNNVPGTEEEQTDDKAPKKRKTLPDMGSKDT